MTGEITSGIDEIDRTLLRILSKNPRMPYTSIAEELESEGFEMSGEGVRHRVSKLLDATSTFFLLAPNDHDWEIVRLGITTVDAQGAKSEVIETLTDDGFWLVCRGIGDTDIYAVATATSVDVVDDLVTEVEAHELVSDVDFSIETDRVTDLEQYFAHV